MKATSSCLFFEMREEDDELPHYRGRRAGCGVGNPRSVVSGFDGVSTISLEKTAPRALNRSAGKFHDWCTSLQETEERGIGGMPVVVGCAKLFAHFSIN